MSMFDLYNAAGRLQFSIDRPPLILRQKIVISLDGGNIRRVGGNRGANAISGYVKTFTISNPGPFVASYSINEHTVTASGTTGSIFFKGQNPDVYAEIYIFGVGVPAAGSGILEIRDANGTIIFNENSLAFKPVGGLAYAIPSDTGVPDENGQIGTYTDQYVGPSGTKIAVLHTNKAFSNVVALQADGTDQDGQTIYGRYVNQNRSNHRCENNIVYFGSHLINRLYTGPTDGFGEDVGFQILTKGSALFIDVSYY